jgi:TatD family-associated radical SAM protein
VPQQISYRIGSRLYLSITDRCTLECAFCPKTQGHPRVHGYDLTMDHRPDVAEIIAAIDDPSAYEEVVFCGYGEPTLRLKVLLAVARHIKGHGGRVRVNTDGLANLVHKDDVPPALGEWVDALSVSLNAQDQAIYERHCRPNLPGSYAAVLEFLRRAPAYVPSVTATAIAGLPGVDIEACERLARECGVGFRRRELDKVG